MSARYTPLTPSSPTSPLSTRPSLSSIRRPSLNYWRQDNAPTRHQQQQVDSLEMEASFEGGSDDGEGSDEDDDDDATGRGNNNGLKRDERRLLSGRNRQEPGQFKIGGDEDGEENGQMKGQEEELDPLSRAVFEGAPRDVRDPAVPGSYDFDRDYFPQFVPPPPSSSPPPFQPNSRLHPALGNSNGIIPSTLPAYPPSSPSYRIKKINALTRTLFGSLLPSYFGGQTPGSGHTMAMGGGLGGTSGVFANLAARPEAGRRVPGPGEVEGPEWVPEDSQKEGPPSYNTALRDAVPPYWETTVVLPSSTSPFGTLTSSASGDDILIDGMAVGNIFAFAWNVLVSFSFQFIGFLLTYVLHTSHAAKHGSRAGLGITLVQYGLYLRNKAEEMIETGKFPTDANDPNPTDTYDTEDPTTYWAPGWTTRPHASPVDGSYVPGFNNPKDAKAWATENNRTMSEVLNLPTAAQVGHANEWLSFMLMALGWFLLLTSVGSYWRVKRFETSLRASQNSNNDDPVAELGNNSTSQPTIPRSPFTSGFWIGNARHGAHQLRSWTSEVGRQVGSRWQPFGPARPTDETGGIGDENSGRRGGGDGTGQGHELAYRNLGGVGPVSRFEEDELLGREAYEYPGLQEGLNRGLPRNPFVIVEDETDD